MTRPELPLDLPLAKKNQLRSGLERVLRRGDNSGGPATCGSLVEEAPRKKLAGPLRLAEIIASLPCAGFWLDSQIQRGRATIANGRASANLFQFRHPSALSVVHRS